MYNKSKLTEKNMNQAVISTFQET